MNSEGVFLAERIFNLAVRNSNGHEIPVRYIGEQRARRPRADSHSPGLAGRNRSRTLDVRATPAIGLPHLTIPKPALSRARGDQSSLR